MNVALIMAGGSGSRMQSKIKKQFLELEGKPILFYTLAKFCDHPDIDKVIVVAPEDELTGTEDLCKRYFPDNKIGVVSGGVKRQISVINGLKSCSADTSIVLIHDAVRPFVSQELISQLILLAKANKAVIPCSQVRYTVKRIGEGMIKETVPRDDLYNAHTPQVFDYNLIYKYHQKALLVDQQFTDDSSILEYFHIPVYYHLCDDSNIKITEPGDLELAKFIIQSGKF